MASLVRWGRRNSQKGRRSSMAGNQKWGWLVLILILNSDMLTPRSVASTPTRS